MGDGISDGHREGLEERARQWKLANFGVKMCYTCGRDGSLEVGDKYCYERYKHVDHLSGEVPTLIRFCSQACLDSNEEMLSMVKTLETFLGDGSATVFSSALRVTTRKLIEDVLRKSRRPNV